jgi:hypothetical protein
MSVFDPLRTSSFALAPTRALKLTRPAMAHRDPPADREFYGKLKPSLRCFHWPFVWLLIMSIWTASIIKNGATADIGAALGLATALFGYAFFIDIGERIWWTADEICQRAWDYFSLKPLRHAVRIREVTNVVSDLHPANFVPGKPFDSISFVSPSDAVTVQLSFHRREEVEELLRLVQSQRPDAFSDPNVGEFMEGGFTEWWRYR